MVPTYWDTPAATESDPGHAYRETDLTMATCRAGSQVAPPTPGRRTQVNVRATKNTLIGTLPARAEIDPGDRCWGTVALARSKEAGREASCAAARM